MSPNKQTVQKYADAFNITNHAGMMSCLTDDVEWVHPGIFHIKGLKAFMRENVKKTFTGRPQLDIVRMTEEDNIVIAEGTVRSVRRNGEVYQAAFCGVFVMQDAKIQKFTSYLMEVNDVELLTKGIRKRRDRAVAVL